MTVIEKIRASSYDEVADLLVNNFFYKYDHPMCDACPVNDTCWGDKINKYVNCNERIKDWLKSEYKE